MGSNDYNVIFPDEILEGMNIEAFTIAPRDHRIGVAILSGKDENMHVLRLYQVIKREDQQFYPTHELEAFSFHSKKDLKEFMEKLPHLTAIELLLIMHPLPTMTH
ncbi:hypothetical protein V7150_16495 [Neobacillus drentensis]|uniref:hypothetical protein n=1 Tax=Neobacillus drentensis TaxID=220684 RepID=UPI003000A3F9